MANVALKTHTQPIALDLDLERHWVDRYLRL